MPSTILPWEFGSLDDSMARRRDEQARARYDAAYNTAERAAAARPSGETYTLPGGRTTPKPSSFTVPGGKLDYVPDFLEELFPHTPRMAEAAPWLYEGQAAPPAPPPVPSSKVPPLRKDVDAARPLRDQATPSIPASPVEEALAATDPITALRSPAPTSSIGSPNPSAASIREKLGFSWGKGVDVDPATGRPRAAGTFELSPELTYGSRTGGETLPGPGGGYVMADPAGAEIDDLITRAAQEQAKRQLERSQVTGQPAPATAGEMLEDSRRTAQKAQLQEDRNTALGLAQARLAAGEYTPEQYAEAVAAVERAYAMDAGVDPRFFSQN